MERPPATARTLAIVQLVGAAVVIALAIVGGVLMQVELAAPGAKWSAQFYTRMLTFHDLGVVAFGAAPFAGVLGYFAVSRFIGAARIPAPIVGWLAFGVWVIGVACRFAATLIATGDNGWTMYTPYSGGEPATPVLIYIGPFLLAVAATIYAVHLAVVVIAHRAQSLGVAIAGGVVVALGGAGLTGMAGAFDSIQPVYASSFTVMAALMFATAAIAGESKTSRILTLVGFGLAAAWAFAPWVLIAIALVGIWIALAILGGFTRPAVAFVIFGCGPAVVGHAFANGLIILGEAHLHDTHVVVGALHLMFAALGFAAAAGASAFTRRPNPAIAWIGALVCSGGFLLHVYAAVVTGSRGMPRRYWDYDPSYTSGHVLALVGSVVLLAGAAVIAVSFIVGRRRE